MTQREVDAAVATATGEDRHVIRRHGFSLVDPDEHDFDPEPDRRPPQIVDWDEVAWHRNVPFVEQRYAPLLPA